MSRSHVVDKVVLIPMSIKLQLDNGEFIAVLPGWVLPPHTMVQAPTMDAAVDALRNQMWRYWGQTPPDAATLAQPAAKRLTEGEIDAAFREAQPSG